MDQVFPPAFFGLGVMMAIPFILNVTAIVLALTIWDRWLRRR